MESLLVSIGYTTMVVYTLTNAAIIVIELVLDYMFLEKYWQPTPRPVQQDQGQAELLLCVYHIAADCKTGGDFSNHYTILPQRRYHGSTSAHAHTLFDWGASSVLLMFSFVTFGSSTNDDLEATDKRISNFMSFASSTAKHNQTFGNMDEHLVSDQQRSDKVRDEDTLQVRFVDKIIKTTKPQLEWDSKTSSVVVEDFKCRGTHIVKWQSIVYQARSETLWVQN